MLTMREKEQTPSLGLMLWVPMLEEPPTPAVHWHVARPLSALSFWVQQTLSALLSWVQIRSVPSTWVQMLAVPSTWVQML
jgi:hypothetical protein